jgi:bacterial/archaeal transporter family-2 protein
MAAMPDSPPSRALRLAAPPLMLAAGALVAVQSQINGRLAEEIGTGMRAGVLAAVISFGTGLAALVVATLSTPRLRRQFSLFVATVRDRQLLPAELVGGIFGALLVASQGLAVGTIGVALFSVAVTAGQSASALLVDHLGFGPAGHQPLSPSRAVAALFAVVAVVIATAERSVAGFSVAVVVLALLSLVAGAGSSVQQAVNGRVSRLVGPWVTTLNNFTVGTVGLLVAFALSFLRHGHLRGLPGQPWLYVGGLLGICFIWLAAQLVRVHGVLVLGLSVIAGQVAAAVLIESLVTDTHVGVAGYFAAGLTVLGVLLALGLRRRS